MYRDEGEQTAAEAYRKEIIERLCVEYSRRVRSGEKGTVVRPGSSSHAIEDLTPCSSWVVGIDESGADFTESGKKDKAKLVAFIAPSGYHLPGADRDFHACEIESLDEYDRRMQALLDTENTGILGITTDTLPSFSGDRWRKGVIYLIGWILRLLPVKTRTTVKIMVENRFDKPGSWNHFVDMMLLDLSRWDKEKAEKLTVNIYENKKNNHPVMSWADFMAFSWGSTQPHAKARLEVSGIKPGCLFDSKSAEVWALEEFRLYFELLSQDVFPPEFWLRLLKMSGSRGLISKMASNILKKLRTRISKDVNLKKKYLSALTAAMEARPLDLKLLQNGLNWLNTSSKKWLEKKSMKMLYMASRLTYLNHVGQNAYPDFCRELTDLTNELYEENAPTCCDVALRMAVSATNDFDYERAENILESWRRVPVETIGLTMWGRLQSQYGQIAAFRRDFDKADKYFATALSAFEKLSWSDAAVGDIEQTSVYRAIAAMDNPACSAEKARKLVEKVVGNLEKVVSEIAVSQKNEKRYVHHMLIRYLVFRAHDHGVENLRNLYVGALSESEYYITEESHPWPLIMLYRAFLIREKNPEMAKDLADGAATLVLDPIYFNSHPPLILFIGMVCAAVSAKWGSPWIELHGLSLLVEKQPSLGLQAEKLNDFLKNPDAEPLQMLSETLPFNFH
jgi:hypothetical protein